MSGAVLVCVGIWLRFDKSMLEVTGDTYFMMTEAYTFIGLGIFVFVVGFFGCCGAIRESKCLLGVVSRARVESFSDAGWYCRTVRV